MQTAARSLPTDPIGLHAEVVRLRDCLAEAEQERARQADSLHAQAQRIEQLLDYIALLKRQRFGPSSERVCPSQLGLFDEAELEALIGELEQQVPPPAPAADGVTPAPTKAKPVRRPLPEHLPRVEHIIDLPAAVKDAMGADWQLIGYDAAEQLAIIPRQPYVIRTLRAKYAPRHPGVSGAAEGVVIAPRVAQILPKAIAHSSLLADIVTAKFVDALPLYRQEKIFAREGIDIPRQSMAGWMIALDEKLTPLMAAMKTVLYEGWGLHIDETRLQVLDEPERAATQRSFMWVYRGGPIERPVIFFEYADSRSAKVPKAFLRGPLGSDPSLHHLYLVSDGYAVYHGVVAELGLAGHAACWAHVRRKFVEAAATVPPPTSWSPSSASSTPSSGACTTPPPSSATPSAHATAAPSSTPSRRGSMTR
jgi:transposase